MPRDEYSDLRRAYAAAAGVTLRTAQRHEGAGHPDWLKFIGAEAAKGVRRGSMEQREVVALATISPSRPEERPAFYESSEEGLSREQVQEKRAWEVHDRTFQAWKELLGDGMRADAVAALAYARELPKLRENYESAAKARRHWEMENRRVIAAHEFEAFVGRFLVPLAEMLRNLAVELPMIANPEKPGYARERILEWQRSQAEPQIAEMLRGAGEFMELPA